MDLSWLEEVPQNATVYWYDPNPGTKPEFGCGPWMDIIGRCDDFICDQEAYLWGIKVKPNSKNKDKPKTLYIPYDIWIIGFKERTSKHPRIEFELPSRVMPRDATKKERRDFQHDFKRKHSELRTRKKCVIVGGWSRELLEQSFRDWTEEVIDRTDVQWKHVQYRT